MNKYVLTFDTDWVSDDVIRDVAEILIDNRIKATWFITHSSPAIEGLFDYPDLFEIGLHPNFLDGSTQGDHIHEVMDYLKNIKPDARSVRNHALYQSSKILRTLRKKYDIYFDASLFLPGTPEITPHKLFLTNELSITRFPYFWEDDIEMNNPEPAFSISGNKYHVDGLKIFDFHPIHIALNSCNMRNYSKAKRHLDISECSMKELKEFKNGVEPGTRSLFLELVEHMNESDQVNGHKLNELGEEWK